MLELGKRTLENETTKVFHNKQKTRQKINCDRQ